MYHLQGAVWIKAALAFRACLWSQHMFEDN